MEFNRQTRGVSMVDLPDAVAMAVALWPDFILGKVRCHCQCCFEAGPTYGQVIFYQDGRTYEAVPSWNDANAEVITKVDGELFTRRFLEMIAGAKA